jgi:hypothetical protein
MVYCTHFTLTHDCPEAGMKDLVRLLDRVSMIELVTDSCGVCTTWYCHEIDMEAISRSVPNVTFVLEGKGDNRMDHWRKRFVNGMMSKSWPDVVWSDFTPPN